MRCIPWLLHRISRSIKSVWRRPPRSGDIPIAISGEEAIVRAVFYPQNLNTSGRNLIRSAFRSPPDKDEVSSIRKNFVDSQFCKDKAKDIELAEICRGASVKKEFRGFAVITAQLIRDAGSNVTDSRHVFVGHADISHGHVAARAEPLPAWLNDRLDTLKDAAKFIPDPAPLKWRWAGPNLVF